MFVLTDLRHRRLLLVPALDAPAGALARVPPASIGPLTAPMAPVIRDGHIALADHGTDRVVVHTPSTNEWHAFPTGPWPRSIAIDDNSAVYVAGRPLERFDDLDGTNPTTIIDAGANAPMAVAATGVFDLDVTMSDGTLRRSHDAGVTWQSVDLQGATRTAPTAIASTDDGGVFVSDLANRRIVHVSADNVVTTVIDENSGLGLVSSMTATGNQLVVADIGWNRIRRYVFTLSEVVAADFLNGRRDDGSYLFDRVTGITEGSAK